MKQINYRHLDINISYKKNIRISRISSAKSLCFLNTSRDSSPLSPSFFLFLARAVSEGIFSYHFLISRIGSRLGKSRGESEVRYGCQEKGIDCRKSKRERKREREREKRPDEGREYLKVPEERGERNELVISLVVDRNSPFFAPPSSHQPARSPPLLREFALVR
jgi:hypothetical protein